MTTTTYAAVILAAAAIAIVHLTWRLLTALWARQPAAWNLADQHLPGGDWPADG